MNMPIIFGGRVRMNDYSSFSNSKLHSEIEMLKRKVEGTGETVFMRMLHELHVYQMEFELQNRVLREAQLELEETRDRYADLFDFTPLAYFTFDAHGTILELNLAGANLLGMDRFNLVGTTFINFVVRHQRSHFLSYLRDCILDEGKANTEFELELPDGKFVRIQTVKVVKQVSHGKIYACRIALTEVTEHRITELKLRLASKVLENTEEGIMLTDAQQRIVAVNPAFLKMTGYERDEVIGFTPSILKSGQHDEVFYREMNSSFIENDGWQGEIWNKRKNGEIYKEWVNIKVIRKSDGQVDCYIGIFSDISNQEVMERKLKELAYYDELTGLANRSLLYDRLHLSLVQARRSDTYLSVLFLGLDHFKEVNDQYGDSAGDYVLKEASVRLSYCLREGDTLARLGGDEFVVILPNIEDINVPAQIAQRMFLSLENPFQLDEGELKITSSVGITISPNDGDEVTVLLKNADSAMSCAKALGGRNCQSFTPGMLKHL